MDISKIKILQATLTWLNETFVPSVGMKPLEDLPYGERANSKSCVIARALNTNAPLEGGYWSVTNHEIRMMLKDEDGIKTWAVPTEVGSFIDMFDDGSFQEYVDTDREWHKSNSHIL